MLKYKKKIILFVIMFFVSLFIYYFSDISIFNKYNIFNIDISIWINIAKQICKGRIIYKDIFDHKGPILYLFYYIGYCIYGIQGIGFLNFICILLDSIIIYKIAHKMKLGTIKSILVMLLCMILFPIISMYYSELPCSESIALPFILISLYAFIKFVNDENFEKWESIYTGLCFGIVLLIRVNLVALWVVFELYIFFNLIKKKEYKRLIKIILYSIIGFCIIMLPTLIYFILNNALSDFINTYILFNIKYSGINEDTIADTIIYYFINTAGIILFPLIFNVYYIGAKNNKSKRLIALNLVYTLFLFYLIFSPQRRYLHYLIPIISSTVIPACYFVQCIEVENKFIKKMCIFLFILFSILLFYKTIINFENKELYDSYNKLSKEINVFCTNKDDCILQIGNEAQIYIWTNKDYQGKYFFQTPIIFYDEEIEKEFIDEVMRIKPKVIIDLNLRKNYGLCTGGLEKKFKNDIKNILNNYYEEKDNRLYVRKEE